MDYPSYRSTVRARGEGKRTWIMPLRGVQSGREGRGKNVDYPLRPSFRGVQYSTIV